jgi:hypothetical protein
VQHAEYHDAAFLLHSDSLKVDVLADKFFHVRDKHSDLRQRAVSLKEMCKELGTQHKFSFIVLDCVTRRVFCAATEHSAPLSFGHGTDGTLVAFCSRIGNKSPSRWPLNGDQGSRVTHRHSQDVRGMGAIQAISQRRASTDPRSQDQKFTHKPSDPMTSRQSMDEARPYNWGKEGSAAGGEDAAIKVSAPPMSLDAIPITHLPSGRFVYGHKYLQPFEFTSFWSSSSNNRSGVPERRFDAHEFQENQRLMNEDNFVVSKSGERKSIDELRCPNEIPRRSLEEHRSRKWATGDHVSDKVDNWRRKSDVVESSANASTKKNVDGSVFAESSFGKSRASTESSNNNSNTKTADGKKRTSAEAKSKQTTTTTTATKTTTKTTTTTTKKLEPSAPPFVPPTLSSKSAPFVPQTAAQKTDSGAAASKQDDRQKVADVKRSSSQEHLNGKADPKGPSGLKKMFAKLFRSGGKDVDGNAAAPKDAKKGVSSVYDTM